MLLYVVLLECMVYKDIVTENSLQARNYLHCSVLVSSRSRFKQEFVHSIM